MGASQSVRVPSEEEEQEEEEEEDDDDDEENEHSVTGNNSGELGRDSVVKKVLEQEPEMLPCHASASPLSPQLSSFGTPRFGPSIKVWDPYNVLAAPPPLLHPPQFTRAFSSDAVKDYRRLTQVYLICHGECHLNLRPDLISGRSPEAALTPNGMRQARALAVFFKSYGIHFSAVYTSPLDRARATALSVCQEMNLTKDQIQSSEALLEMSQGQWEGCHRSEILTPETMSLMDAFQADFFAPSGESLRQVEFRMVEFLNGTVMGFPEKIKSEYLPPGQSEPQGVSHHSSDGLANSVHECDGPSVAAFHLDFPHRHWQGVTRKKSGKSRLQIVTNTSGHEADGEMSPREPMNRGLLRDINIRSIPPPPASCIGVFTHSVPIKCLITGLLGCGAVMSHKICIDDSSVTVLQHSWKSGWQIKRLNDTAHLRLL